MECKTSGVALCKDVDAMIDECQTYFVMSKDECLTYCVNLSLNVLKVKVLKERNSVLPGKYGFRLGKRGHEGWVGLCRN